MAIRAEDLATIKAKVAVPSAVVEVRRVHLPFSINHRLYTGDDYWLDMSLGKRDGNSRIHYANRWKQHHFEPVGSLFLLNGGEPIYGLSEPNQDTTVVCRLYRSKLHELIGANTDQWSDHELKAALNITNSNLQNLMMKLADEAQQPGFGADVMIELISGQIAIELHRHRTTAISHSTRGGLSLRQLRLIDERLKDETDEPASLSELANLCNISVRHLSRAFRESRDCTIGDYVAKTRIERAKRMLMEGQSIKSIAPRVGFSSASSFAFAFRRATGFSPGDFRWKFG